MRNIYFTTQFVEAIENEEYSIELKKYKLGKLRDRQDGKVTVHPSEIDLDYMYQQDITSPTEGFYLFESIYSKEDHLLKMNIQIPSYDESMSESDNSDSIYRILYVIYKNILTGVEDLAFIIYDRITDNENKFKANGLYLSRFNNLINIEIPFRCEVVTKMDEDTSHLEGPGVSYLNYYTVNSDLNDSYYIEKNSYGRYYYNKLSSNEPYYGEVTINKFGLKSY